MHGLAGINYPLRGEKHTTWAGGYRVASFVSGGVVPASLRGTTTNLRLSIVDWYPTFCAAAGLTLVQCAVRRFKSPSLPQSRQSTSGLYILKEGLSWLAQDDSPTPPKKIDPTTGLGQDIYGSTSWPGLDGVDVWPLLLKGSEVDIYAAHPTLVVSAQVLLHRETKLLLGQGDVGDSGPKVSCLRRPGLT